MLHNKGDQHMEITTHEITTPMTKTKVVVKDWITGYDDEGIQAHYLNGARAK